MISNTNKSNQVPIMGLSQKSDASTLKRAVSEGCTDFIIKPFNDDVFIYKVNELLGLKNNEENSSNKFLSVEGETSSDLELLWDDSFKINIKQIDDEHRSIIEKYSKLYYLMKKGLGQEYYLETIPFLKNYVNTHFTHEEILHKKNNCYLQEEHRKIH
jgi:response regulator RpfG family c-di-GMP phosphodiesterase